MMTTATSRNSPLLLFDATAAAGAELTFGGVRFLVCF
jgi:hypothetical protein